MALSQRLVGFLKNIEELETGELKLQFQYENLLIQNEDRKVLENFFRGKLKQEKLPTTK